MTRRGDSNTIAVYNLLRFGVAVRWMVAATVSGAGVYGLVRVLNGSEANWLMIFAKSLFGLAAMISGVVLASPECVEWAVSPICGIS